MVNYKINSLKTFNPTINKILKEDLYDTEDISEKERRFFMKHKPAQRISRVDLTPGDIVVVLEGVHMGKRVVFIKQLSEFKALVSGISSLNGASLFKIDERYLFKLRSKVEVSDFNLNVENVYESKPNENKKVDVDLSSEEKEFERLLLGSISKVPYMKTYLSEAFKIDHSVEFYSQEY
ncbi:uncharacterized protein VICG_01515 [Vittaforma corneae ATCC 50505]|uniref:Uncharacterized protein n=1 Tax=Vittaforma corneae (strain ATCC 50505) TaxID=993615 RepID=L2GLM8_VITCO|nr:uncharacterized protein VICG_01515 [Vittaforma corneae ATCC 50505]ELA41410.1 hypothetical protein VICG_01515 [Vittaforma corneae ATCC 50505]